MAFSAAQEQWVSTSGDLLQVTIEPNTSKKCLEVTWRNAKHVATLKADVEDMTFEIIATITGEEDGELHTFRCIISHHISSFD